ncbi:MULTISPECIES: hypothetical protein [unclassified Streptomyces]|uniref:hypothetical protein n=1 Tax=unclassified Streptomyces TaxID=2593676 RepID=UPI002E25C845
MAHWSNESLGSCAFGDPCSAQPQDSVWPVPAQSRDDIGSLLTSPQYARRTRHALDPHDQRRLALHAALTAAGIPPMPEDRAAIDQISALPADVNDVLQRWLHHAL